MRSELCLGGSALFLYRKTEWLIENYDRIVTDGGPGPRKRALEACPGREAKIRFMKSFRGIGDKYARNLLMDITRISGSLSPTTSG